MYLESLSRLLCPWISPGKKTGVGRHPLLQGISPTQGSNLGLLLWKQIIYHLSHHRKQSHWTRAPLFWPLLSHLTFIISLKALSPKIVIFGIPNVGTQFSPCMCAWMLSCFSCVLFCDPVDCSPPGSSVHGILQARILEWVCHALLQGIFLTQGLNPALLHLLHWQVGSLPLAPPGKPNSVPSSL